MIKWSDGIVVFFLLLYCTSLVGCTRECSPRDEGVPAPAETLHISPNEICIVTHYTGDSKIFADKAVANHSQYSSYQGHQYKPFFGRISGELFNDPSHSSTIRREGLYWQKISAVKQMMAQDDCKWIMWIDSDAVFTNFKREIASLIKTHAFRIVDGKMVERQLLMPRDESQIIPMIKINNGVFIIKNSPWSQQFMNTVEQLYPYYKDHVTPEQDAFQDLIYAIILKPQYRPGGTQESDYPDSCVIPEATLVSQRSMDSFYRASFFNDPVSARWQPCDFILHASAISGSARASIFDEVSRDLEKSTCE